MTMTDRDPFDAPDAPVGELGISGGDVAGDSEPESATVLELDMWSRMRGEHLAEDWEAAGLGAVDPPVVADAAASLFEVEPVFAENPADRSRAAWWRQLLESPECQALRSETIYDPDLSALAARSIVEEWSEFAATAPKESDPGSENEPVENTIQRIRSTARAVSTARESVETARDLSAGLGLGDAGSPLDFARIREYFARAKSDEKLRSILAMAGRMRSRARSVRFQRVSARRGEITGIEFSGDIDRLVPGELASVAGAVPELEILALLRLAERRALSYRARKRERVAAGPIVVCVDESGSMNGDREITAKGLALAMAWVARQERRWCALVGFSGGTAGTRVVLPPGEPRARDLVEWLEHFYGGGTTLDVPLVELPAKYWPSFVGEGLQRGRTDVVIITDGCVECPDGVRDEYRRWASRERVTTYSLIIGETDPGGLAAVSDRYWCVPGIGVESDAVDQVLSV